MITNYDTLNIGDKILCHSSDFPEIDGRICSVVDKQIYNKEKHFPYLCNDTHVIVVDVFGIKPYMMINVFTIPNQPHLIVNDFELI